MKSTSDDIRRMPVQGSHENAPLVEDAFSSIAQSVEHAAVNRAVVGSSPTRGVRKDSDVL